MMAAPHAKKPRTGGPRMSLQLTFGGVVSMEAFNYDFYTFNCRYAAYEAEKTAN